MVSELRKANVKPIPKVLAFVRYLKRKLPYKESVLDLGCGKGRHTIPLAKAGFDVDAIDLSIRRLKILERRAALEGVAHFLKPIHANVVEYSFQKEYGAVISTLMLRFLPQEHRQVVVEKVKTATRPGGYHYVLDALDTRLSNGEMVGHFYKNANELKEYYSDWKIIKYEELFNTDAGHLDLKDLRLKEPHQHKIAVLIAQKP